MSKTKKVIIWVVGVLVVLTGGLYGLGYSILRKERMNKLAELSQLAKELREDEAARQNAMLADTYGGKTPEETLGLFIKAVESGDYYLASKYFVLEKQGEWKDSLIKSKESGKIENFLVNLNSVLVVIKTKKKLWQDNKRFMINEPFYISFFLYQQTGLWKIDEI